MLRQRQSNNFSKSQNKISPSPKPFSFPNQGRQGREHSESKHQNHQHRRMKTQVLDSHDLKMQKKRAFMTGTMHHRVGSVLTDHSEDCLNKSFNMINSKIQNILSNYKEYDKIQQSSVSESQEEPRVLEVEMQTRWYLKKEDKRSKYMNKQNQMWNSKIISERKLQSSKEQKSSMNVLKDITAENLPEPTQVVKKRSTLSTTNISGFVSFEELQESSDLSKSNNGQSTLSYSNTSISSQEEMIKRPKLFERLKNISSQKIMAVSLVEEQEVSQREFTQKDKLINLLYNQIMIDERFIKAKQWFKQYRKEHKWWLLERQLKKNRLWINQLTMKATFVTKLEEESPEQTIKQEQFSIKTLVIAFKEAQEHWLTKIRNSFDYESLKREGFIDSQLGTGPKGYISIEDLIRFINFELKTFYSTRQLQLIYLRLKQSQHLQFYDLVENITKSIF